MSIYKNYIHDNIIHYVMYQTMKFIWESTSYGYIDTRKQKKQYSDSMWHENETMTQQ